MRSRFALLVLAVLLLFGGLVHGQVHVRGYYRKDGTYVRPHYRSSPDGNFWNNWSTYPNVNPYTGAIGTKRTPPPGYGGSTSWSPFTGAVRTTPAPQPARRAPPRIQSSITPEQAFSYYQSGFEMGIEYRRQQELAAQGMAKLLLDARKPEPPGAQPVLTPQSLPSVQAPLDVANAREGRPQAQRDVLQPAPPARTAQARARASGNRATIPSPPDSSHAAQHQRGSASNRTLPAPLVNQPRPQPTGTFKVGALTGRGEPEIRTIHVQELDANSLSFSWKEHGNWVLVVGDRTTTPNEAVRAFKEGRTDCRSAATQRQPH